MSLWKQLVICLVVVIVAGVIWLGFLPGGQERLQAWGVDWAPVASTDAAPASPGRGGPGGGGPGGGFGQLGGVVTAPVLTSTINDRLSSIGTGAALRSVAVTPFTSGRLTEVLVSSGASLAAGEVIARLDAETEEIAVDRARIALDDALARLERLQSLRASNTVTSVQVSEAELAVRNAELALRDAELALERRSIVSPISGVVGIIPVSEGNYVTSQTEIATIDDRSRILIDFWVPERYSGMLRVGQSLAAMSVARPNEVFDGEVSAVDNRIDAQSRTLRVQAAIANPDDTLRAGMSFQVQMRFPGDSYPAVDPLAIQWGTDGAFVWAVNDGVAERKPVRIVQRNSDSVLIAGDLAEGIQVVTEGVHNVREGREVRIARRSGEEQPQRAPEPTASTGASGS